MDIPCSTNFHLSIRNIVIILFVNLINIERILATDFSAHAGLQRNQFTGNPRFVDKIASIIGRRLEQRALGRSRKNIEAFDDQNRSVPLFLFTGICSRVDSCGIGMRVQEKGDWFVRTFVCCAVIDLHYFAGGGSI